MIVVACLVILFWLLVSYFEAQQALQWWYSRQAAQLGHQAEAIRNGLLQESFTLRRSLELGWVNRAQAPTATEQEWLATIEHFHDSLKQLSDHLSPPYIDDSLPLAIQAMLETWKSHRPLCQFSWDLPLDWHPESPDRSRLVLTALDELLRLMLTEMSQLAIVVRLHPCGITDELTVQFTTLNPSPPHVSTANAATLNAPSPPLLAHPPELRYLSRAFRFLTFGECFPRQEHCTVTWYFRWQIPH